MQKHSCQSHGTFVSPVTEAADWRQNRATPWAPMNCAPQSQHVWAWQWVPGRTREVLGCRRGISYQLQWPAHTHCPLGEGICRCSAALCPLAPNQLRELVNHFPLFMHRGNMLEFMGMTLVLTHSPSFRQGLQTLTQWVMTVKKLPRTRLHFAATFFPHL